MNLIKYEELKKKYDQFYESFYNKGQVPVAATPVGIWGAAITEHLKHFFQEIKLNKYKTFLDLGSGDGKVVLIASLFGVKATGVEFDQDLIDHANNFKKKLNLKAEFIQANFFDIDLCRCQ